MNHTSTIQNPILPGFNPDPSICRVGDDFYIATSTFEWFPGVQVYHSRDLANWSLRVRPLDRPSQLDMRGIQSSGGVWAPCLTWHEGCFYLIYTVTHGWHSETPPHWGDFKDTPNFLVTAPTIDGPWSEPIRLNASGFDPSLFHDFDGRSWLVNMEWDYRKRGTAFTGILMQEYDRAKKSLVGPITKIFGGSLLGTTEGPHLFRRKDWYYLVVAEGGTSWGHAVTMARSRQLQGPWDLHPRHPLLNSLAKRSHLDGLQKRIQGKLRLVPKDQKKLPRDFYDLPQKAGHASMVEIDGDEWAMVHLGAFPLPGTGACVLGRETCIERLAWGRDDWPYVLDAAGKHTHLAQAKVRLPLPKGGDPAAQQRLDWSFRDDFDKPGLHPEFRSLRGPWGSDAATGARPGWLRLVGRESPVSTFSQTIVATSVKHRQFSAETVIDFMPGNFQQMAGLLVRYDERNQYYARITHDARVQSRTLGIMAFQKGFFQLPMEQDEIVLPDGLIGLRVAMHDGWLRFSWALPADAASGWQQFGPALDACFLSDESAWPMGFTGAFVGVACHDMGGAGTSADFDWFDYREMRS